MGKQQARGEMILVRYADDFVVGFEHRYEAERFRHDLTERLKKFNLELHGEKTRLIEFGRYAETNRARRGLGKPETFNFLGFTHICSWDRRGRFCVLRQTMSKRIRTKLKTIHGELKQRMHHPTPEQGQWLRMVLRGHYQYYGVPRNYEALQTFRHQITLLWKRALERRSQRSKILWERMNRLASKYLPNPRICHPYPDQRLRVTTRDKSRVR